MNSRRWIALAALVCALALAAPPTVAADPAPPASSEQATTTSSSGTSSQPQKHHWWRKLWPSAEQDAQTTAQAGEQQDTQAEPTASGDAAAQPAVPPPPVSTVAPAIAPPVATPIRAYTGRKSAPARDTKAQAATSTPRELAKINQRLRAGRIGQDPIGKRYLDLVDANRATPAQLNAFGMYLADHNLISEATQYVGAALRADKDNPDLWVNLGTLQQKAGEMGPAAGSFRKALAIEPNHALAHYNLGVTHDVQGDYEGAIDEYKKALTIDPKLADPNVNPQVVNNERLTVVRMLIYQEQAGTLGLPLIPLPGGDPSRAAQPAKSKK